MKNGKAALYLTGGYLLGRFHKARWALGLAGLAVGKRLKGGGAAADLLKSPALGQLGNLRGELVAAGRTAAVAAAGNRMDALSDRLQERAEAMRSGTPAPPAHTEEEQHPEKSRQEAGEQRPETGRETGGESRSSERREEIARRRADRMRSRASGGARQATQTGRGVRRAAMSETSGGRPGRDHSTAAGESSRRNRG